MAERYTRLFTLPENLYAEGAPLIIAAGALLKDNQTGKVLSQLKFRSISDRMIKAVKVLITGYDMGNEAVCREEHQYLDLEVKRDNVWGTKEAIALSNRSVRSYSVTVLAVYFHDGSRYDGRQSQWEPLEEQLMLEKKLWSVEYIAQYKLETTEKSEHIPMLQRDIWLCACGEVNHVGENCFVCGESFEELNQKLDIDFLRDKSNLRQLQQAEKNAAVDALREASFKKLKKLIYIAIPIILIVAAISFFNARSAEKLIEYEAATKLMSDGKFSEAEDAFKKLDNYSDSKAKAEQARAAAQEESKMQKALKLMEKGDFDEARELFLSMKGDAKALEYAQQSLYLKAIGLLEQNNYVEARETFSELGDYRDSKDYVKHFIWKKTGQRAGFDPECEGSLSTVFEYDSQGRIVSETRKYSEYEGKEDKVYNYTYQKDSAYSIEHAQSTTQYDKHGNPIGQNGQLMYEYEYGYHSNNKLKYCSKYTVEDQAFLWCEEYDENGSTVKSEDALGNILTYNNTYSDGRLIEQQIFDSYGNIVGNTKYQYSDTGDMTVKTENDAYGNVSITEFFYGYLYAPEADVKG